MPNGINGNFLPIDTKDDIKSNLNLKNKLLIVTIGRLIPLKGINKLIQLLPELRQDISLVVMGDGPERRNLELISSTIGVKERVIFTGNINKQEVTNYLKLSDLFVLYSDGEFSPFVILEAMACGLPVVASKIGGLAEFIEDGKDGILVRPKDMDGLKDAILKVLQDDVLRLRLISNAYAKVSPYTLKKVTEETLDLFNEVLNGSFN